MKHARVRNKKEKLCMEQRNGQPIVVYDTTGKWSGALLHDEKRLPQAILQILYKV